MLIGEWGTFHLKMQTHAYIKMQIQGFAHRRAQPFDLSRSSEICVSLITSCWSSGVIEMRRHITNSYQKRGDSNVSPISLRGLKLHHQLHVDKSPYGRCRGQVLGLSLHHQWYVQELPYGRCKPKNIGLPGPTLQFRRKRTSDANTPMLPMRG